MISFPTRLLLETVKRVSVGAGLPRDSVDLHKTERRIAG
ncbi:MAG: hypothetical protein ACI92G_000790 [Candidatus Pelagisphaera sp.]|jgi:hypothetical protein